MTDGQLINYSKGRSPLGRRAASPRAMAEPLEPRRLFAAAGAADAAADVFVPAAVSPVTETIELRAAPGRRRARVADPAGIPVDFRLTGPGEVRVTRDGDFYDVVLTGTNRASALAIAPADGAAVTLRSVSVDGSLGKFNAAAANLAGTFEVAGTLGSLRLDDVVGPSHIRVNGVGRPLRLGFDEVADLSVTSATPIAALEASQWLDAAVASDVITAPRIGSIQVAGDFGADLNLTATGTGAALRRLIVGGVLDGSKISAIGDLQNLIVGALRNSTILAGVAPDAAAAFPAAAGDFAQPSRIGRLTIANKVEAGYSVEGSNVAAPTIGSISFGSVAPDEQGFPPSSVTAGRIGNYLRKDLGGGRGQPDVAIKLKNLDAPSTPDQALGYLLTIL